MPKINVIRASAEALTEENPLRRIERAGRLCYASEDKIGPDTAEPFVHRLMEQGHMTPLESAFIALPVHKLYDAMYRAGIGDEFPNLLDNIQQAGQLPFGYTGMSVRAYSRTLLCNARQLYERLFEACYKSEMAIDTTMQLLKDPEVALSNTAMTLVLTCDRGIGNELVRHRSLRYDDNVITDALGFANPPEMSMLQQSTRYISYSKQPYSLVLPEPSKWARDPKCREYELWFAACSYSYCIYLKLLELGQAPQMARNVLPLSTATKIIMTGTKGQWRHFLDLRTAKAAHPQMRLLCLRMLECPEFYEFMSPLLINATTEMRDKLKQELED